MKKKRVINMNKKQIRAMNDYTANLPESEKQIKEKKFVEPAKVDKFVYSNSPVEQRSKKNKTEYVI